MQYTTKAQQEREQKRRRHEAFLQRYNPTPQEEPDLTNPEAWRTTALSESREVLKLAGLLNPSGYEWEYFTDNASAEFIEDIQDYVASGRALADGISEDVCRMILGVES